MKAKWLPISAAVAMALASASASAVDFHGYMRSGVGVSDNGGMQTMDKHKVGRLGNEDETYSEVQLGQEVYNKAGKSFYVDSMFSMQSSQARDWENTGGSTADFALRQFNVQAKNLFGGDETFWVGKRYYQRHDIHVTDFYYWDVSGAGAGIENIKVGPGQMAVAWLRNDPWAGQSDVNTLDLRYAGIPLWQDATLELGYDFAMANPTDAQDAADVNGDIGDGHMITAELTAGMLGGFNKTVVQYFMYGLAHQATSYDGGSGSGLQVAGDDGDGFRLINWGVLPIGDKVEIGHSIVYGKSNDFSAWGTQYDDRDTFSIVARPIYKWNDVMKTVFEAGYYKEHSTAKGAAEVSTDGSKFTLAQAWSAGSGFWARPELRVFVSYLQQDDSFAANKNGVAQDDAWNFGVQAEAWW